MATRCPDCSTAVIEELDYCFGCFRHLATRPSEKPAVGDAKRSRFKGRKARKDDPEETAEAGFLPDDELVDAAPKQSFMTWQPGSIPKGTLIFGSTAQESDWRRTSRRDDR